MNGCIQIASLPTLQMMLHQTKWESTSFQTIIYKWCCIKCFFNHYFLADFCINDDDHEWLHTNYISANFTNYVVSTSLQMMLHKVRFQPFQPILLKDELFVSDIYKFCKCLKRVFHQLYSFSPFFNSFILSTNVETILLICWFNHEFPLWTPCAPKYWHDLSETNAGS